jgi:hypothetical protein
MARASAVVFVGSMDTNPKTPKMFALDGASGEGAVVIPLGKLG